MRAAALRSPRRDASLIGSAARDGCDEGNPLAGGADAANALHAGTAFPAAYAAAAADRHARPALRASADASFRSTPGLVRGACDCHVWNSVEVFERDFHAVRNVGRQVCKNFRLRA